VTLKAMHAPAWRHHEKVANLKAQIDADRDLSTSLAFDSEPAARAM